MTPTQFVALFFLSLATCATRLYSAISINTADNNSRSARSSFFNFFFFSFSFFQLCAALSFSRLAFARSPSRLRVVCVCGEIESGRQQQQEPSLARCVARSLDAAEAATGRN